MKCEQIRDRFFDAPNDDVKAHLAACPECERAWTEMQGTMMLLDEWTAPEPSAFFDTKFRAHLAEVKAEEAQRQQSWFAWLRKPGLGLQGWRPLAVGALGIVMVVGVSVMDDSNPVGTTQTVNVSSAPGTAVSDLQALEKNEEAISNLELLDDLTLDEAGALEDNL
jgi:hypothetical protein